MLLHMSCGCVGRLRVLVHVRCMRYTIYAIYLDGDLRLSELHLYSVCDCIGHASNGRGLVLGIGHTTNKNIIIKKNHYNEQQNKPNLNK